MLSEKLVLHDIADTEAFAARIIQRSGLELSFHDSEELLAFLIETAWELSRNFERNGLSFSTFAGTILKRRVVDWQRRDGQRTKWQFADRTYERQLPVFVVLDDDVSGSVPDPDRGADGFRGLVRARRGRAVGDLAVLRSEMCERTTRRSERSAA